MRQEDVADMLSSFFTHAATSQGISLTSLKSACRRLGIARWPYMRSGSSRLRSGASSPTDSDLTETSASMPSMNEVSCMHSSIEESCEVHSHVIPSSAEDVEERGSSSSADDSHVGLEPTEDQLCEPSIATVSSLAPSLDLFEGEEVPLEESWMTWFVYENEEKKVEL
ncbi:hypothetical protein GUITHDRAFT_114258 [Guillardia theta CCMP2712]|uniref:RWP-RK domain-containing protein n=1 Tax=Guillardia theta (strain CCMP2712) TaxID=905079 RepID=L1IU22_GUITC|nr:hypothetical protein GUITHDRAFT_114258 [Guillardia theta CCMP2712]EKX39761.1 hypothetical protein GUITHDRAFT_114258 [Guillardia theta CCMP2712]|eukprot:XP_005826741.1 hypothetical protein GUITHDRAFT_114258 [Guillardia theta CCMP2712]